MSETKKQKGYHGPPKPLSEAEKRAFAEMDIHRDDRGGGPLGGKLGCLLKLAFVGAFVTAIVMFVIWWHPWETRSTQVPTTSRLCSDDETAMQFREQFLILDYEVSNKNKGVVCVSD